MIAKTHTETDEEIAFKFKPLSIEESAARASALHAFEERQRQEKIAGLRRGWGVWKRHAICQPSFTGPWGEKFSMLKSRLGSGFLMAVVGIGGNGKTQIGAELLKVVTQDLKTGLFTTAAAFFTAIKETYRKNSDQSESEVLQDYRSQKLLVIDEFGKRGESEWEMTQLFELINNRYGDMTDTLLIDNRKKDDFLTTIGPSLASRMQETGGIIEANWESFRK